MDPLKTLSDILSQMGLTPEQASLLKQWGDEVASGMAESAREASQERELRQKAEAESEALKKELARREEQRARDMLFMDWLKKKVFGGSMTEKRPKLDAEALAKWPSLFSEFDLGAGKEARAGSSDQEEEAGPKAGGKKKGHGRRKPDADSLPVVEADVYPEGTTGADGKLLPGYRIIGKETETTLERCPGTNYKLQTNYYRVMKIEEQPSDEPRKVLKPKRRERPIKRCLAGITLLADIIMLKFVYHLPFYRILALYRAGPTGVWISSSTVCDWYEQTVELLKHLYDELRRQVLAGPYVQIDESVIPVLDHEKQKSVQGYLWAVRAPLCGDIFFHYDQRGRSYDVAKDLLEGYQGIMQSDCYGAYDQFENNRLITMVACWAHARRYFIKALEYDRRRATEALAFIKLLYKIEHEADEKGMAPQQRQALRQEKAAPVLKEFEQWLKDNWVEVLPHSPIGEAIHYAYSLFDRLSEYVKDGRILPDNNLIENAIRPLAIGRKNWLFCQNDAAATRHAIVYSLLGCCKAAGVDPRVWLEDVLDKIVAYRKEGKPLAELLPRAWKESHPDAPAWNTKHPNKKKDAA